MEGAPDRPRKRQRAMSIDSDDLDAEEPSPQTSAPSVAPGPLRPVGEFMICGACAKRFTVVRGTQSSLDPPLIIQTAYTKEHPKQASTYLCMPCTYAFGIDPYEKPKKAKAKPVKKEERGKITHYEVRKGVVSLGSLCIKVRKLRLTRSDQTAHRKPHRRC
jgi:DNA repair protein RAD7